VATPLQPLGPPPLALENSLTDTEKKTPKKKKKRFVSAWAVPGNCSDGQTDTENKTPKQQNKTKQNKKIKIKIKRSVLVQAVLGNCPDNSPSIGS
jgi:hypothetical protein